MATPEKNWVVYMCSWCGATQTRSVNQGRPHLGNCPRRPRLCNGQMQPHRWTISKKY